MTIIANVLGGIATAIRLLSLAVWDRIVSEPVLTLAVISAGIALALGFGANITKEQAGLLNALAAAILGWIARRQVTPVP